eukprot:9780526-Alexandrium_andersonii.AAC.1
MDTYERDFQTIFFRRPVLNGEDFFIAPQTLIDEEIDRRAQRQSIMKQQNEPLDFLSVLPPGERT